MDTPAISADEKKMIKGIVALIASDARLYVFGSRAKGTAKKSSDLDLVLKSSGGLKSTQVSDIKELLKATRLPYSVDIMDWDGLSAGFQDAIKNDLVEI